MNSFNNACALMPETFKALISQHKDTEEIRLRCGYPPGLVIAGCEHKLSSGAVEEQDILHVLEIASGASLHAVSSLKHAYISYKGLRIGISGHAIYKDETLVGFRKYSSLAVRIPRQCLGIIPDDICNFLTNGKENLLICAGPGVGKTTALRELIRCISEKGIRVCVADERCELSGECFELGSCTDVMCNIPRNKAAMIMLRALNPQLIAMDEITQAEDLRALKYIAGCGVSIFATAHGRNLDEMLRRPLYRELLAEGIFENLLTVSLENGKRSYLLERIET